MKSKLLVSVMVVMSVSAWGTASAQTDIEYKKAGDISLLLDAYQARGESSPAVILVHGGAWVRGDRHSVDPLIRPLVDAGFSAFTISYRYAPEYFYTAAVADVQEAVRFVRRNAARFHVDPDRIALLGESAGAHLASLAALDASSDRKVQAVVSLYGPMDFVRLAQTSTIVPEALRRTVSESSWGALLLSGLGIMSPTTHVQRGAPPFLFVHGTNDPIVPFDQSTLMCEAIRKAQGVCDVQAVDRGRHGLREWEADPHTASYKFPLIQWLKEHLRMPSGDQPISPQKSPNATGQRS